MDILLLTSAVFLGFIAGIVIGSFTKEEISTNRKYFILAKDILLILLSLTVIYSYNIYNWYIYFLIGLILGHFLRFPIIFLGVIMGSVFTLDKNIILIISSLIFFIGLVYTSLNYYLKKINISNLTLPTVQIYFLFTVPAIAAYLIDKPQLGIASSGALIGSIILGGFIYSSFKTDSRAIR